MHDVKRALQSGDVGWLACWLVNVFPSIPEAAVLDALPKWLEAAKAYGGWGNIKRSDWQDDDWRIWFENRLREIGWTPPVGGKCEPCRLVVPMHVFFIHLEETKAHLANLWRADPSSLLDAIRGPSTPGIERAMQVLTPVDRTAGRVVSSHDAAG